MKVLGIQKKGNEDWKESFLKCFQLFRIFNKRDKFALNIFFQIVLFGSILLVFLVLILGNERCNSIIMLVYCYSRTTLWNMLHAKTFIEASSQTLPTQSFTEAIVIKLSASEEALEMVVTFDWKVSEMQKRT